MQQFQPNRTQASMLVIAFFLMLNFSGSVKAQTEALTLHERIERLENELKALKASAAIEKEAAEYHAQQRVIKEVIEDARTRSFTTGQFAGFDGKFFLRSLEAADEDDSEQFRLNLHGHFQFRHMIDHQNGRQDATDSGFQARRAKLGVSGHVFTPTRKPDGKSQKIKYAMTVGSNSGSGSINLISYSLGLPDLMGTGVDLVMGRITLPFLKDELVGSKRQLAVERASVTEFFTVDKSEQVQLQFAQGGSWPWQAVISVHDGASTEMSQFGADPVEIGVASRMELALMGSLRTARDYSVWEGKLGEREQPTFVIGGAWLYQLGDPANGNGITGAPPATVPAAGSGEGQTDADADYFAWTVDADYEHGPFGLFAAVSGGHIQSRFDAQAAMNREMYGVLAQSRYNLKHLIDHDIEPFVRYEWIHDGMSATEHTQMLTVGANWYHWGHHAKLTSDVVWFFDGDLPAANPFGANAFSSGLGLSGVTSAQALVFRTQYQLMF